MKMIIIIIMMRIITVTHLICVGYLLTPDVCTVNDNSIGDCGPRQTAIREIRDKVVLTCNT